MGDSDYHDEEDSSVYDNLRALRMDKPTEEQVRKFWEWCGLPYGGYGNLDRQKAKSLPPIDLNNLFKYAVDWNEVETVQFSYGDDGHHCWIYMRKPIGKPFWGNGLTDEDALFWALWQVKELNEKLREEVTSGRPKD